MKKFKYRCYGCGFEGVDNRDGIGCPVCNGRVIPTGDAKDTDPLTRTLLEKVESMKVLEIKPEDTLVVAVTGMSFEDMQKVKGMMEEYINMPDGAKVLVIDEGTSLAVIRRGQGV